jgi:crossover junction endodeoxyribonuclease RusA
VTRPAGVVAEERRSVTGERVWIIPLGFTSPPLSLNGRPHWRTRAKLVKAIRTAVWVRGKQLRMTPCPHVHVLLHYVPKDRRHRDPDNLVATLKPAIDALTAAGADRGRICLGVVPDDTPEYVSWSTPRIHDPDEHGPRLWLEVTALLKAPEAYGMGSTPTPKGSNDAP